MKTEFKKQILFYLEENEHKIKLVWQDLSEDDIWNNLCRSLTLSNKPVLVLLQDSYEFGS